MAPSVIFLEERKVLAELVQIVEEVLKVVQRIRSEQVQIKAKNFIVEVDTIFVVVAIEVGMELVVCKVVQVYFAY